ncbi:MAG: hypothetical protein H6Q64_2175 [Firmicutes bacterium]|nr:hypothetical protein [Bacillota bacterium]
MDEISVFSPVGLQKVKTMAELRECNDISLRYGLSLSEQQMQNLAERHVTALRDTGRIEFGSGILKKLVMQFCNSPFIFQDNYEDTLLELQDAFYYFKNESKDRIPDDELIEFMKQVFDGRAQGSLEYLCNITLEELCRNTRYGYAVDDTDRNGHMF